MSMIRGFFVLASAASVLAFGACGGSDYQGGGRRTDLGKNGEDGVGLAAGGDPGASGGGSAGGELAGGAGQSGFAGCAASGVDGLGLALGCTP